MLVLTPSDISMNVITIMNKSMNISEPPGGVGGGADWPLMCSPCENHRLKIFTQFMEELKHIGTSGML